MYLSFLQAHCIPAYYPTHLNYLLSSPIEEIKAWQPHLNRIENDMSYFAINTDTFTTYKLFCIATYVIREKLFWIL